MKFLQVLRIFGGFCFLIFAWLTVLSASQVNGVVIVLTLISIGLFFGKDILNRKSQKK